MKAVERPWIPEIRKRIAESKFVPDYNGRLINEEVRDAVASIIGEGVHTGLRKFSDTKASTDAWKAINTLPDDDWNVIVMLASEAVLAYLFDEAGMPANVFRVGD